MEEKTNIIARLLNLLNIKHDTTESNMIKYFEETQNRLLDINHNVLQQHTPWDEHSYPQNQYYYGKQTTNTDRLTNQNTHKERQPRVGDYPHNGYTNY